MKNNKKNIGRGMKARDNKAAKPSSVKDAIALSAQVGQEKEAEEVSTSAGEAAEQGENRGSQETDSVQNLESGEVALGVDLAARSEVDVAHVAALLDLMRESGQEKPQPEPVMVAEISREELEESLRNESPSKIQYEPTGLGEQPDGTFVTTVTIQEGYIEPIRQQAEADGVTVDEWLSTRLTEYLSSWWQPAPGREKMPVFLVVSRRAQCEICLAWWDLQPQEQPEKCAHCGSVDWEWGLPSRDSILIRQQVTRLRRVLNPGARSLKRQARAKAQEHSGFQKKPEAGDKSKKKTLSRPNRGRG